MAQAKVKGLEKAIEEAIDEMFKDSNKAIRKALETTMKKAKDDLYGNAVSCLQRYYDEYDPTSYRRTYNLIDSFVPYSSIKEDKNGFMCSAGVEFDADKIENTYYGSDIYSPTDAEWIISNFLNGIHPRTDGSKIVGGGNYEFEKKQSTFIPSAEMQRYIDRYQRIFENNFRREISTQVLKLVKK